MFAKLLNIDMEPEIKAFLKKVAQTLFGGLLWMTINATLGIMFELGFPEGTIEIEHILFYAWLIISLCLLLYWFYKMWSEKENNKPGPNS